MCFLCQCRFGAKWTLRRAHFVECFAITPRHQGAEVERLFNGLDGFRWIVSVEATETLDGRGWIDSVRHRRRLNAVRMDRMDRIV